MSRRNSNQGFFQRIIKSVTEPIRKIFGRKPQTTVETKPKKDNIVKRLFQRITSSFGTQKGTTKRIPVAKYSDFSIGWKGKPKPKGAIKQIVQDTKATEISIYGKKVDVKQLIEIEDFVDKYNETIAQTRKEIIENLEKYLDPLVAENTILDIERAVKRDEMRFTQARFDDLRDLEFDQFAEKILRATDYETAIAEMFDSMYYDIQKRYETYRESYIKAIYNEMGENTATRELVERIQSMSIDKFMVSYYDVRSGIDIKEIYEPDNVDDPRIQKIHDYFDKLDRVDEGS